MKENNASYLADLAMKEWINLPKDIQETLMSQQEKDRKHTEQNKTILFCLTFFIVGFVLGLIF
ncbi:MAG: hypothetical protein KAU20_05765 [Nanoarchaeota archaeon]|nr:hypothetical protein [Nanoarchaeota archaeon]